MIDVKSISIEYGTQTAIRNASLSVSKGSLTAIVGPSGCGKSSFLSAINRMTDLIPHAKVTGQILIDNFDINSSSFSPTQLRKKIGMIFQKPNPFPMSIQKNIQLALIEHGTKNKIELAKIIQRVLEDVGLWDEVKNRLDSPALNLSGGQQQRLCIARSLALEPEILLLDEPCSALDPIASSHVEALIQRLKGHYTMIVVTHNLAQAKRIADNIAVFWFRDGAGEIIEQGSTEEIFNAPQNPTTAAYLSGTHG